MNKHREILNKILADLISDLDIDQVEQLQKTIIGMVAINNAKVTNAFVKFETEIPSETCEIVDFSKVEVPGLGVTYARLASDFEKVNYRSSNDRVVDIKSEYKRLIEKAHGEAIAIDRFMSMSFADMWKLAGVGQPKQSKDAI